MPLTNLRYALRSLWLNKGFAIVAILCLGFGIGLNTTIFSVVDGVLLKPLPYEAPDRIRLVNFQNPQQAEDEDPLSYLDVEDLREASRALSMVAASQNRSLTISDGGDPERYSGAAVSWNLFPLLGIAPVHGRLFREDEDRVGAEGAVLLSHAVWTLRYQADPGVLGRRILINAAPATIVGVMPPDFEFPQNQKIWIPLAPVAGTSGRGDRALSVFARLAPGVTADAATAELGSISARLSDLYPGTHRGWTLYLRTLSDEFIPREVSTVIWLMMAAVMLVLFIACSNVANLQLARATARQRELALRTALGAGRGRIVRQLLAENVVLALVSVPLGLVLAVFGTRLIASAMPPDQVPYYIRWAVDWRTATYAIAVAIGTAVIFGLLPALQASRSDLVETLKEGTRGNSVRRSWLRSGLVVIQVSLALVSLVSALLFVRSFVNLESYDVGYDTSRLMTMRFYLPGQSYEPVGAKGRRVQDIVERVERLPGVEAVFASNLVPLSGGGGGGRAVVDGHPVEEGQEPRINFIGVTPLFMETLGLPVRGRTFTTTEGWSQSAVALVSDTMARQLWPGGEALGGRFRLAGADGTWFTVIGIVPDFRTAGVDPGDGPESSAFVSYAYQETLNTGLTIRVAGDPTAITSAVREEIRAADANMPVFAVRSMDETRRLSFWQYQLYGWIFGTIGVVGLLLAAVGVYGVLSYAVNQRTAEIGVRIALGADRRQVLQLIVGHGMTLAGVGIGIGLVLAAITTPLARQFFYNVSPFDPMTFAGVAVFLALVAAVASVVPARRAMRVDPMIALRGE